MPTFFRKHFVALAATMLCTVLVCGFNSTAYALALAHQVEHSQPLAHHHHDNLEVHSDSQDYSEYHAHADSHANPAGILISSSLTWMTVAAGQTPLPLVIRWLAPPLAGLYRPPRVNSTISA